MTATKTAEIKSEINTINEQLQNTLNNGYVVYDGNEILVVDALPKESAQNAMKIDGSGISFKGENEFETVWALDNTLNLQSVGVKNAYTQLYNSTSGENGVISLSESAENFTAIVITYTDGTIYHSTVLQNPNGRKITLSCLSELSTDCTAVKRTQYTIDNTELTPDTETAGGIKITPNGTEVLESGNNFLKIISVEGYYKR